VKQQAISARVRVSSPGRSEFNASASRSSPMFVNGEGNRATAVLLTEPEVADRLRVSLACLRRWRLERRGPRFLKLGSLVRYPVDELDSWIASLPTGGSARGAGSDRVKRATS
jgi:predicted DNA-binding transcriptional regulator AlpA